MTARKVRVLGLCIIGALVLGGAAGVLIPRLIRARRTRRGPIGNGLTRTYALVSPNGKRVAEVIHIGEVEFVGGTESPSMLKYSAGDHSDYIVLDGKKGNKYDSIDGHSLLFSPDSRRFAYGVETGKASDGWRDSTQFYVVDGVETKRHELISAFLFSPDSKRTVYLAENGKDLVVLDGNEFATYDATDHRSLAFSDDSEKLLFSANVDGSWTDVELHISEGR